MAKAKTEYQKLVAEYRKKHGKGPPVGTSTVELRKLLKKRKRRKSTSKPTRKSSSRKTTNTEFMPDWARIFWGQY